MKNETAAQFPFTTAAEERAALLARVEKAEAQVAQLTEWVDEAEDLLGRLATGNPFRGKGGTPDYWAGEANDLLIGLADARAALDAARPADTNAAVTESESRT